MKLTFLNKHTITKLIASLLAFLIILSAPFSVFAQEAEQESTPTESTQQTESEGESTEQTLPEESSEEQPESESVEEEESEEEVEEEPIEEPEALLDDDEEIVDHYRNQFETNKFAQVDESSGVLKYDIPLVIPPGRNGIQPDLALQYSSRHSPEGSIVGYGWSLSIPYIQRINKRGMNSFFDDNYFTSSISGELATSTTDSTHYRAKVENGDFLKYQFSSNVWTMTDKEGTVYTFGTSTDSRQDQPGDSSRISKWMLDSITDTNGNKVRYEYFKDSTYAQIYPYKVYYTGNNSTEGIFEVEFSRASNADYATSSSAGFKVETRSRINEITAKINGSWARKYSLEYGTTTYGYKALLMSVTETGRDENEVESSLPPYEFEYQESDDTGWVLDENWTLPVSFTGGSNTVSGAVFAEVNGDGLPDIIYSSSSVGRTVYLHTGTGWTSSSMWQLPTTTPYISESGNDRGVRVVDVNGDGLDDIISYNVGGDRKAFINNGTNGWTENAAWYPPVPFVNSSDADLGVRLLDVNGDGLVDIAVANQIFDDGITNGTFLNTGSGWATSTHGTPPVDFVDLLSRDLGVIPAEVNGDGQLDYLRSYKISGAPLQQNIYLSNGGGWTTINTIPGLGVGSNDAFINSRIDWGYRFADINGDHETDIMLHQIDFGTPSKKTSFDRGPRVVDQGINWISPLPFVVNPSWHNKGVQIVDFTGDGMVDLIKNDGTTGAYVNTNKKADLLISITYPTGGSTEIEHQASQQYKNGSDLLNKIPFTLFTVSSIAHDDGLGNDSEWDYSYQDGHFYYNSSTPLDRTFAGFGVVTRTAPTGDMVKTYFHQASSTISSLGEYDDHISKAGKPYRIETLDGSNNKYTAKVNKWEKVSLGNDAYNVKLTQALDLTYDGDVDHKDKAEAYTYDTFGNLTQKIEWGEVTGSADGTFSDTGSDKFTTNISYASSTSYVFAPSGASTTDQSSNKVKETRYYYDTLGLGSIDEGNLTKEELWKSSSNYIDIEKTYNGYGLVIQEKDPRDKTTSFSYDSANLYVASSTNPLSHNTLYEYDYSLGKPKEITDANTRVFQTIYDGLDRVKEEKQPDISSPGSLVTKTTYTYTTNTVPSIVQKTDTLSSATSTDTYTYFDGLGRIIQTRKEAESSNTFAVSDIVYNSLGLKQKESLPYFSSGSARTSATTTNNLFNRFTYDPIQRITAVANASGTTTHAYDQWMNHIENPRSKAKNLYQDAYNNLWKVDEIDGVSGYATEYVYNYLGNPTKITDALGNVRNFTYDGLGRRLTAQDLHATADTHFGSTTFAYDDSGNMTQKVDAKNQTINYTYDDLNRALTEDYTGSGGTEITLGYDSCPEGKGRICSATTTASVTNYEYNALGLQKKETKTLNSVNYVTQNSYDRLGNITNITYPDNSQVAYNYNAAGLLEAVARKENSDAGFTNIITNYNYSPLEQITLAVGQNGVQTTNTYDTNELYRLKRKQTINGSGTDLQDISYSYDANGNISQIIDISDTNGAKTATYTYDDLDRLTQAVVTATSTSSGSWYNSAWNYRVPIVASSTKVLEDIKDVYFNLSALPAGFFTNAKSDSCDLRMTKPDGTTELAIDLVTGSTTGQLHFSTGSSLSSTTASTFYLYYGNPSASCYSASATYGAQNVYDSNTKGVWHLEQNSASTGAIIDSTAGVHHGTMYSNFGQNANGTTTGKIGHAAVFDGTNDTIDVPESSDFEGTAMTIEAWVYMDTSPSSRSENADLVVKKHSASPWRSYALTISNPDNRTDGSWVNSSGSSGFAGTYAGSTSALAWHHVILRQNPADTSAELSVRTDGSSANTYTADTNGTTYNSNDVLRFGADYAGGSRLDGNLDEIRIHNVARSDNYITTRYNNMNSPSTFWSVGSQVASSSSATTTASSYTENYTYNILGNIMTKTGKGTYAYTGTSTSNYANPHAATSIGGATYTYDNNGNLATAPGITNSWDFRNRLTQTVATSTVTYAYDHQDSRVMYSNGVTTTYYPNQFYNASSATTTKHIFDNKGNMIATLEGSNASTTVHYVHTDHLSGSNVISNSSGSLEQLTDYYPYGSVRLDEKTGSFDEQRGFTGKEYDSDTGYNYFEARYYDSAIGRFVSQDPVFLVIGDNDLLKQKTGLKLDQYLADPQGFNSYAYARNNPLRLIDENGEWYKEFITGQQSWSSFQLELGQTANQLSQDSAVWNAAISHPITAGATIGVGSGLAAYGASAGLTALSTQYLGGIGTSCIVFCSQVANKTSEIASRLSNLNQLDVVTGAQTKLQNLSNQLGVDKAEILQKASQSTQRFIDLRNNGNINILMEKPGGQSLIRVTTDPSANRIISAGQMQLRNVVNNISKGNFKPLK